MCVCVCVRVCVTVRNFCEQKRLNTSTLRMTLEAKVQLEDILTISGFPEGDWFTSPLAPPTAVSSRVWNQPGRCDMKSRCVITEIL